MKKLLFLFTFCVLTSQSIVQGMFQKQDFGRERVEQKLAKQKEKLKEAQAMQSLNKLATHYADKEYKYKGWHEIHRDDRDEDPEMMVSKIKKILKWKKGDGSNICDVSSELYMWRMNRAVDTGQLTRNEVGYNPEVGTLFDILRRHSICVAQHEHRFQKKVHETEQTLGDYSKIKK